MSDIVIHLVHSTHPYYLPNFQDPQRNMTPGYCIYQPHGLSICTVHKVKVWIASANHIRMADIHLYLEKPTLEQVKDGSIVELIDDHREFGYREITDLYLIVRWRPPLTLKEFHQKLPHFSENAVKKMHEQLSTKIMTQLIDWSSITEKETTVVPSPAVNHITFEDQTVSRELEVRGEVFVPNCTIGPMVEMVGRYVCQYRGASDEVIQEFTKQFETYQYELTHCKKLLHYLPIALENNIKQIVMDVEELHNDSSEKVKEGADSFGELAIEQGSIRREIEKQELKLKGLIEPRVNEFQFIERRYQSRLELPLCGGFIQLVKMKVPVNQDRPIGSARATSIQPSGTRRSKRKQKEMTAAAAGGVANGEDDDGELATRRVEQRLD